jgi:predicted Zn-dependent protease
VACRHISQKIDRTQKVSLATLAGIAAGIFLGAGGAGAAANAITVGSMAAGQSVMLAYSREDEIQADQIGLKYLNKADYGGNGLLTILKKIRSKQWFGSDVIPTYLSTHPAVEDRMAYIDTWIQNHPPASGFETSASAYEFERARTRLIAAYGNEATASDTFKQAVERRPQDPLAHYGYGLVLARTGNLKEAAVQLKSSLSRKPFDPYILEDLGKIYFQEGRYADALKILGAAVTFGPEESDALIYLGKTQIELGRFEEAVASFERMLKNNPGNRQALYSLGEAYGRQGNLPEAHYFLGLYYDKMDDYRNAAFHLKRALNGIENAERKSRIEEMLDQITRKKRTIEKEQEEEAEGVQRRRRHPVRFKSFDGMSGLTIENSLSQDR